MRGLAKKQLAQLAPKSLFCLPNGLVPPRENPNAVYIKTDETTAVRLSRDGVNRDPHRKKIKLDPKCFVLETTWPPRDPSNAAQ